MLKDLTIDDIQALTIDNMEELRASGKAELITIKEHDCYFMDLGGYFGYSVLVFKNGKHIHYANNYQSHNRTYKSIVELKQQYIEQMNYILFSEAELMQTVNSYDDYTQKSYYVRNYWIMQFEYISMFCIGDYTDDKKERIKAMTMCRPCYCYVDDKKIAERAEQLIDHIKKSFDALKENETVFREMVASELSNHEAGYTGDYTDGLAALGLNYNNLETRKRKIVIEELKKQIDYFNNN